jgi:D-sedoheptulose 7-phosphate isomerase
MIQLTDTHPGTQAADYLNRLAQVLALIPHDAVARTIDLLLDAQATGRRVYIMGNGGSASTASHLVCDLTKTARVAGQPPLRAFALADNGAVMTAWANDTAFDRTFAEQVDGLVELGDVVIAISASGNSSNIVAGLRAAAARGAHTVSLVGFDGGAAALISDVVVHVPCRDYGLVEDSHSAIGHALTAAVRQSLQSLQALPA